MESKGCKRFATTEAEIKEKRLKLNAERTIKQQKMAKILHTIQYNTIQYFIPIRVPQGAITNIHS